jgi:hypothetical protein
MKLETSRMPDLVLMGIVLIIAFFAILYYAISSIIDMMQPIVLEILTIGFSRVLYTLP